MVGLGDIPCVGKFVERLSEYTVDAVFRSLKYMLCYKSLVNNLNSEIEKLNIEKDKMCRKVKEEEKNGKVIQDYVWKWQKEVEEIQEISEELSPSCSCIQSLPIPDPISSFRIGKHAVKKAETVTKLTISGMKHLAGDIAYLPEVIYMPNCDTTFEDFQSRKDVYEKLWDALVDQDSPLIHGIYGMPGVGKTRTMEKFWEDAMKKKIFDKVVRVNVGNEKLDKLKLQDQIAGCLDCNLQSQDVDRRASQLEISLRSCGKILLILDDVWREIPLGNIIGNSLFDGSSSRGSKILLTSREQDVCLRNKCKHLVEIQTLSPREALSLFKNTVGSDTINSLQDESLVQKVCNECAQLPLLIHAVGKALTGKPQISWKDALVQLEKGKFEKIVGVDPQVYACIKLSIDNLRDDDAKSCLFLCSLFPEDDEIDMKMLIQLATGSQLIPDGEPRVLAMVHYLKVSSLLLDCGVDYITKVHDIIRDVARSIASTDSKYAFLQVTCNSGYFPSDASYCKGKFLRLDAETDDVHFKEREVCPDLHTLWLQCNNHPQQFSGGFYKMFVNLNFLMLQKVNISLKQFSLQPLDNLGTLTLSRCDTRKTDGSLFPKSLKTLCIWYCDLPRPLDVANLKYLRKLEIQQKRDPELVMALNVISSLSSLEELHIPNGFIIDCEEYHTEPIVMEICELTHLASLQFHFYADHTFRVKNVFSKLDRYSICVGAPKDIGLSERYWRVSAMRSTRLYGHHSQSWEGLMTRAEEVILSYSNVEVSSICNGQRRAFEDLNKLYIENCDMEHLASISCISHDEIQYSLRPATCFSKLTILKISHCSEMKYLFCNNIAKNLGQLQELTVNDCKSMEAIILNEGTSKREVIIFSKLKLLKILFLSRLKSFYVRKKYMISGSTLSTDLPAEYQYLFDGHVAFPSLKELTIQSLPNSSVIWGKDCYNDNGSSFCKLNNLSVSGCDKLESLIPQAMLHRLNNLEHIEVCDCSSMRRMFPPCIANDLRKLQKMSVEFCLEMREIIGGGEQAITDGILFPELMVLELDWLPSLTSFWCYQSRKADTCKVAYNLLRLSAVFVKDLPNLKSFFHGANFEFHMPALEKVQVCNCGLSDLFTFSMFRKFQLKSLLVNSCDLLENLVEDSRGDETCDNIITLFQLTSVDFQNLPKLRSAFHNANYEFHMPVLTNVFIRTCGFSDTLFNLSVIRNLKQLKTLEVSFCSSLEGLYEDVRGDEHSDSGDQIITLPQLSLLLLENLPSLKSIFYSVNYECKMPALMKLKVVNCGISTLFTWSICRELQQLKKLVVVNCWLLKHIVENEKCDEIGDMNDILFPELKILALLNLPSLTDFWCYQRGKTNTCKVAFTLLQLSAIVLNYLPDLESFFHGANFEFHMPVLKKVIVRDSGLSSTLFTCSVFKNLKQLEYLKVSDCKLLEGIVEDNETTDTSENIITLDRVSTVQLQGLPKLKSIFCGASYECYMPGLKKVKIVGCGPSILFTCSVFREIPRLQELHVSDCGLLEHVVEEAGSDQTSETNSKSIRSSKLSSITLESLPNLRSFSCTSSYVLNILKLQNLRVIKCPRMEYFSSSTTTSLVNLAIDWYCEEGFQDLNDFIRQYHKSGSCLSYCSEETSYRIQDLGTQSEIIIEEEEEDEEEEEEEELLESETETEIGTETEGGSETDSSG